MLQTVKDRAEEEQRKKDKRAALMRPSRASSAPVMSPAKEQPLHSPSASPRRTQGECGTARLIMPGAAAVTLQRDIRLRSAASLA